MRGFREERELEIWLNMSRKVKNRYHPLVIIISNQYCANVSVGINQIFKKQFFSTVRVPNSHIR